MSSTVIYVVFGIAILLILVAILRSLDWFGIFTHFYGNNTSKAKIYVDFGENELYFDGDYIYSDEKLVYYQYFIDKKQHVVAVPMDWDFIFIRGRRKILVDFGKEFAKPLTQNDRIPAEMGSIALNASIKKKLAVDMVNSLESHKGVKMSLITIIIVAVIVVAGYLYYQNQKKAETPPPGTTTTTNTPEYPDDVIIVP
jgi:hypothetical protein